MSSRHIRALKIPAALTSAFVMLVVGYYYFYVSRETRYWVTRDFRLLATIGEQIQTTLDSSRTVLESFLQDRQVFETAPPGARAGRLGANARQEWFRRVADDYVPILRSLRIERWNEHPANPPVLSLRFVEPDSRRSWVLADAPEAPRAADADVALDLKDVLEGLFSGEIQTDIFASVALATTSGRVIFQTGEPHLKMGRLDELIAGARKGGAPAPAAGAPDKEGQPTQPAAALPGRPTAHEVELAGAKYTLFLQPCCQGVTEAAPEKGTAPESGWLVCGLVSQSTLKSEGQAFPYGVIAWLSGVLLLAIFSWPFVKLMLIGELQRVRVYDVVLVGVCALLGLSAITLFAIDLYAYQKLTNALDGQLERFAESILDEARREKDAAANQLGLLVRAARGNPDLTRVEQLARHRLLPAQLSLDEYPFFESFALMDQKGMQKRKWTLGWFVTPVISVAHREYFKHWRSGETSGSFLEPIRSATTGAAEAVLSMPTGDTRQPVGALTIPMRSLLNPIVVEGFGFVVIDDDEDGRVLFHSDPEHNLSEDIFAETDGSRRLRALLNAKHAELLDLRYWGVDHRAYVTPMGKADLPWSLVTFYDKQLVRTVNIESIISAALYTLIYTACYVVPCLIILLLRPDYRAPWMWPDATRVRTYLRLVPAYALFAAAFMAGLAGFSADALLWTAWLLPLLAWTLSFVVLGRHRRPSSHIGAVAIAVALVGALLWAAAIEDRPMWRAAYGAMLLAGTGWALAGLWQKKNSGAPAMAPPLNLSYGIAAGSLVLLTTVLPAATFFKVAYGIHSENFIKNGQLKLARDLSVRDLQDRKAASTRLEGQPEADAARRNWRGNLPDWGVYSEFFFETKATTTGSAGCADAAGTGGHHDVHTGKSIPAFLEELLPYYTESSVRLRELMHGGADDGSWRWQREGRALGLCMDKPGAGSIAAASVVPTLIGDQPFQGQWLLLAGCAAIAIALVWVIRFAIQRIFVVEVIEPLWSGNAAELPAACGPNLFLLCETTAAAAFLKPSMYDQIDLEEAPGVEDAQRRWFEQHVERLEAAASAQNLLILHFEHRLHDPGFNELKLTFVEHLINAMHRTVVIVSAVSPDLFFGQAEWAGVPRHLQGAARSADTGCGRRWAALMSAFSLIPAAAAENGASTAPQHRPRLGWRPAPGWAELLWRANTLSFGQRASFLDDEGRDPFVRAVWSEVLPYAWQAHERAPLDLSQLLVEVGERLENYYRGLWASCSSAERLVLAQIAAEGLVNGKSSRTVRGLMARGWIRREPHFRLMNETFRRFVLSAAPGAELETLGARHGAWDSVRGPFLTMLAASAVVFFATQRQLFQQTVGVLGALTASLPALVQVVSLLGRKGQGSSGSQDA